MNNRLLTLSAQLPEELAGALRFATAIATAADTSAADGSNIDATSGWYV